MLPDRAELHDFLSAKPELCAVFKIPGANIERVHARYINTQGDVLVKTEIAAADCARDE
jgi:hypothetical protein